MPCPSMLVNHSRKLRQYVSKFWAVSKLSVDLLGILIRRLMFMFVKSFPTSQSLCDFPPKLSIYNESVDRWFVLMQLMHVNQIFFLGVSILSWSTQCWAHRTWSMKEKLHDAHWPELCRYKHALMNCTPPKDDHVEIINHMSWCI